MPESTEVVKEEKKETAIEVQGEEVKEEAQEEERPTMMIARSPDEMVKAQEHLISFFTEKIEEEKKELRLKQENLDHAKTAKIRTDGWKREVTKAEKRVRYYSGVLEALKAGYCIIPDFPIGLIAIRTDKERPRHQDVKRWYRGIRDEKCRELEIGTGRYVGPEPASYSDYRTVRNSAGKEMEEEHLVTYGFKEVDFPIRFVRPQIIEELNRAMAMKLFDEIGILPGEAANRRKRYDPMLIGRMVRREGPITHVAAFLITWWIDPKSI